MKNKWIYADEFCVTCGSHLVVTKETIRDFDSRTGKARVTGRLECPENLKMPWYKISHTAIYSDVC